MPYGDQTPAVMNRENSGTFFVDTLVVSGAASVGGGLAVSGSGADTGPWIFNVQAAPYGAVGDGKLVTDGSMTSGSNVLACTTSLPFTKNDINKIAMVKGAGATGQTTLIAPITNVTDSGHAILGANAATTVSSALVMYATDDTAAINMAIAAAVTYAQAFGGAARVFIPASAGQFYGIGGPLVTGGTTKGNSQITIPIIGTTGNKVTLTIEGVTNGSGLQHWQQLQPQCSGSTLVSFGVFANPTAQTTSTNAGGNPALIGGPSQPGGYGISPGVFSNMLLTLKNLSLLTSHSAYGLTYTAADLSGIAEVNLENLSYGTTGNVPAGDFSAPAQFANGASIGLLMPANGNNDNCLASNVGVHGGYTWAFFATEHTVINAMRILYCWSAFCPTGTYFGSVGATHAIKALQLSIESCTNVLYVVGAGSAGVGPIVDIDQLDTESSTPTFTGKDATSMNGMLGTVKLTGLFTPSGVAVSNPTGLKIINGQVAVPVASVTANYAVTVLDQMILVDATAGPVTITLISAAWTPNTYTVKKIDSSANAVTVATVSAQTIDGASTLVLSAQWAKATVGPARVSGNWNWYTR